MPSRRRTGRQPHDVAQQLLQAALARIHRRRTTGALAPFFVASLSKLRTHPSPPRAPPLSDAELEWVEYMRQSPRYHCGGSCGGATRPLGTW